MIKLIEDNVQNKLKERFPNAEKFYKFQEDNETIGLASINHDTQNKFYIFINENIRGQGYGKKLYSEIIKELNNQNFKEVGVNCSAENIPMRKILDGNGAKKVSQMERTLKYEVPIGTDYLGN